MDLNPFKTMHSYTSTVRILRLVIIYIFCFTTVRAGYAQEPNPQLLNIKYSFVQAPQERANRKENYKLELYFYEMLNLALKHSSQQYHLQTLPTDVMVNERKSLLLQKGELDIHWLPDDMHLHGVLLPVHIPLLKGLMGWRLMLLHKDKAEEFSKATDINLLQQYVAGQGRDWSDTKILEFNKFKVAKVTHKSSIMDMLELQRIDYYPRSMLEIWSDLKYFPSTNIVIDTSIAFSYPLPVYFFVHKDNLRLHDLIYNGLNIAIDNGSFDKLFQSFFADALVSANLQSRHIHHLKNPFLSEHTPLADKRLWYKPLKE